MPVSGGIEATPGESKELVHANKGKYKVLNNNVVSSGDNDKQINEHLSQYTAPVVVNELIAQIAVTPNPSKGSFNIQLKGFDHNLPLQYRITDMSGRVLETRQQLVNNNLNVGNALHAGMYLLEVTQGNMRQTVKLVKE